MFVGKQGDNWLSGDKSLWQCVRKTDPPAAGGLRPGDLPGEGRKQPRSPGKTGKGGESFSGSEEGRHGRKWDLSLS